jgi:hypothetical protein
MQGGPIIAVEEKSRAGSEHKKEKYYIQSRNVYENKQKYDNLSAPKGESFA